MLTEHALAGKARWCCQFAIHVTNDIPINVANSALLNICAVRESILSRTQQWWSCPVHSTSIYRCQQQHCSRADKQSDECFACHCQVTSGDAHKSLPGSTTQIPLYNRICNICSASTACEFELVCITLHFQLLGTTGKNEIRQDKIKERKKRDRGTASFTNVVNNSVFQPCYLQPYYNHTAKLADYSFAQICVHNFLSATLANTASGC